MKVNVELRNNIFEVLEKQMKANDPPETKINFKRLIKEGYSKADAQVVWTDGPKDWATELEYIESSRNVYYIAENGHTVSFYLS
jgi:hypothetical protein